MITLMTGVPGTGKTAKIVHEMSKIKDRPLFAMGIPDLKVEHTPVPPVSEWVELRPDPDDPKLMLPYFTFPPNAIVVIDEAQRVYRPRAAGTKVPDIVAAFETHRHTGVDFWLMTQAPALLDANIRRLVTKHWHIHPTPLGRKLLEWSQCREPDSKMDRADAMKSNYSPPKAAFKLYKSAEVHTKVKRAVPKSLLVAVGCLVLAAVLAWYGAGRIKARVTKGDKAPETQLERGGQTASLAAAKPAETQAPVNYLDQFTPQHPNFPESAPAYDALRVVKAMPVVAGCIKTADWCRCYTQQGTKLDVQPDRCADYIANRIFDPYREPVQLAMAPESRKPEPLKPAAPVAEVNPR